MQEAAEMYLETILVLRESMDVVRSVDIANELNYSRASVSVAVHELEEDGYIIIDEAKRVSLTKAGEDIAKKIYDRHQLLTNLLLKAGVNEEVARTDACRIEHYISDESILALQKLYNEMLL